MTTTLRISVLIALAVGLTQFHATGSAQPKPAAPPAVGPTATTTALLDQPCKLEKPVENVTITELFQKLSDLHGVTFRLDVGYLRRQGFVLFTYETKVSLPIVKGLSVRDVLQEVIDGFPEQGDDGRIRLGIQVKGSQVIITKAFRPPAIPGELKTAGPGNVLALITQADLQDMFYGPTVGLAVEKTPLADVIQQLQSSGANIVVDPRVKEKLATPVTLTVNDARLMTVLKIVGDMCEVSPAVVDNVYYLTTRENAERMTSETERTVFGEPRVPIPAGFVTDGRSLYEKPANLKPVDPDKLRQAGLDNFVVPSKVPESVVKPLAPMLTTPEKK